MKTIAEGKQHLRDNFKTGATCPCCNKYVKAYKRKLNSGIARSLIIMHNLGACGGLFIHVQDEFAKLKLRATTMDYAYAEKWKLIRAEPDKNGYWSLTDLGKAFVLNQTVLPDHCLVYNGNVYSWSNNLINIEHALTESFDYQKLMTI